MITQEFLFGESGTTKDPQDKKESGPVTVASQPVPSEPSNQFEDTNRFKQVVKEIKDNVLTDDILSSVNFS